MKLKPPLYESLNMFMCSTYIHSTFHFQSTKIANTNTLAKVHNRYGISIQESATKNEVPPKDAQDCTRCKKRGRFQEAGRYWSSEWEF
jgi:hypothetical protein